MLTIRNIDVTVKERLRVRAAAHGHSMEAEVRRIIQTALANESSRSSGRGLADRIHARFAAVGGVDLELPQRQAGRDPPTFE
jgi:plasmid stability protein